MVQPSTMCAVVIQIVQMQAIAHPRMNEFFSLFFPIWNLLYCCAYRVCIAFGTENIILEIEQIENSIAECCAFIFFHTSGNFVPERLCSTSL